MASQFIALLNKQRELMLAISQTLPKFKKLAHVKRTKLTIKRRMEDLQKLLSQVRENHADLQTLASDAEQTHAYFTDNLYEKSTGDFDEAMDFLEDVLVSTESNSSADQSEAAPANDLRVSNASFHPAVPLPKFKLPRFSGEINEWEEFRDRFTSIIINDTRLSDSDRMKYLCSSIDGPARRAIAHIRLTDANFQDAWSTVCDKFQNVREIIKARVDTFHVVPTVSADSLVNLQLLQESVRSTPRSLQGLGRPVDGWSDLYVDCIMRKLDRETKMLLTDRLPTNKEPITLSQIDDFIEHRLQVLQSGKASTSRTSLNKGDKGSGKPKLRVSHSAVATSVRCVACSDSHPLFRCSSFRSWPVDKRRQLVKDKRCCWLCLSASHRLPQSTSTYRCHECKSRHNVLLHPKEKGASLSTGAGQKGTQNSNVETKVVSLATNSVIPSDVAVLLATAWVKVYGRDGRNTTVRALLDQGSEATLLSEHIAQLLKLPRINRSTKISGVGGINCMSQYATHIGIGHRSSGRPIQFTDALVVTKLTQIHPRPAAKVTNWSHLTNLQLADPDITGSQPIDVIIGAELYSSFLRKGIRRGKRNSPVAQKTSLGWIVSGSYEMHKLSSSAGTISVNTLRCDRLESELQKFWLVEELQEVRLFTPLEQECEEHFSRTFSRTASGRYIVRLPFRSEFEGEMGNSRGPALKCLASQEQRLQKDALRQAAYGGFLREYEDLGHMLPVDASNQPNKCYYIPHHAVFRTVQGNTKIRVVFNASKKTSLGFSLNDQLLTGPRSQTDLSSIILRWRFYEFVMTSDIAKMYRQILINTADLDYQRILWRDRANGPVQEYCLQTVTYGMSCAPYQALRVVTQLAHDEGDDFPIAKAVLEKARYIDDCFFGGDTVSAAVQCRDDLINLLARGGFPLSKWAANDTRLLTGLTDSDIQLKDRYFSEYNTIPVLGINWNPSEDAFHYRIAPDTVQRPTKRAVLSHISKLF